MKQILLIALLISISYQHTCENSLQQTKNIQLHDLFIKQVRYSPNQQYILTCSGDKFLKITDSKTYEEINKIEHESFVLAGEMSPDSQFIVTGGWDKILRIYDSSDIKNIKLVQEISGIHQNWISSLNISKNGEYIVTSSADKIVRVFEIKSGKLISEYKGHNNMIYFATFAQNDKFIISGDFDGTIKVWDTENQQEKYNLHSRNQNATATSAQIIGKLNDQLISSSWDGSVIIWDLDTQKSLHVMEYHEQPISQLVISQDNKYMITVDENSDLRVWDLEGIQQEIEANNKKINYQQYIMGSTNVKGKQLWGVQIKQINDNNYEVITTGETGQLFVYQLENLIQCYEKNKIKNEDL